MAGFFCRNGAVTHWKKTQSRIWLGRGFTRDSRRSRPIRKRLLGKNCGAVDAGDEGLPEWIGYWFLTTAAPNSWRIVRAPDSNHSRLGSRSL